VCRKFLKIKKEEGGRGEERKGGADRLFWNVLALFLKT
jgi:hypothetical protein